MLTSCAATVTAGLMLTLTLTELGCCVKLSFVAVTSILFLSAVILDCAPPAFAVANPDPLALAVALAMVNCICWLSVTVALKLKRNVKFFVLLSSAVTFAPDKPENAIVPLPITGALFTKAFPKNKAALRILALLVTLKVIALSSVPEASASLAAAPPSRSVN